MVEPNPQAALFQALAKAQSEMKNAPLNKINPHFKSKYADLASIRDAVIPALTKHGISVFQSPMIDESGRNVLVTTLAHSLGGMVQSHTPICSDSSKPQPYGSALTYARRYGLAAICGIASDEDDDGNVAQGAPQTKISEEQEAELSGLIAQSGADKSAYLKYLGITSLSDLPAANYPNAKKALQAKIEKVAA
jgi:hypothetical protein